MRKPAFLAVTGIVSVGALSLAACGSNSPAHQRLAPGSAPITIGVSVSLTGDFSGDGKALVQGYDLWAQDENAKGGLLGHHVTMKYVDDASSTTQVVTNYQNLITRTRSRWSSDPSAACSRFRRRRSPTASATHSPSPRAVARASSRAASIHSSSSSRRRSRTTSSASRSGCSRCPPSQRPATAAYATEDDPFTQPQIDKAKSLLEAGGVRTVSYKVYPAETTDFTPLAQKVIAAECRRRHPRDPGARRDRVHQDVPAAALQPEGADRDRRTGPGVRLCEQGRGRQHRGRHGPRRMVVERQDAGQRHLRQRIHRQVRRHRRATSAPTRPRPTASARSSTRPRRRRTASTTPALIAALHTGTYQTVQGPMAFDSVGKPSGASFLVQWQNGLTVPVYPPSVAVAQPEYPKPAFSG